MLRGGFTHEAASKITGGNYMRIVARRSADVSNPKKGASR
jgi:hypothetical protein